MYYKIIIYLGNMKTTILIGIFNSIRRVFQMIKILLIYKFYSII